MWRYRSGAGTGIQPPCGGAGRSVSTNRHMDTVPNGHPAGPADPVLGSNPNATAEAISYGYTNDVSYTVTDGHVDTSTYADQNAPADADLDPQANGDLDASTDFNSDALASGPVNACSIPYLHHASLEVS